MFAQDSTLNSSSDDEGVMSHFVLSKPRETPYSALKRQREKDGWPSEMLLCCVAIVCAVVLALMSAVGYTVFVHVRLVHLENLVQKLQTGLEGNSSGPSLNNLKMTVAQIDRVKMLTDLSQFQNNLSAVHDQFVTLQRFYKDMEENPNIVQFLRSITEQLTPLSQSVVLMSDGFNEIQKSVTSLETDRHTMKLSIDELTAFAHNLQSSVTAVRNETHAIESRLSIVELFSQGAKDDDSLGPEKLQSLISQSLNKTLRELNFSARYTQPNSGASLESEFHLKDLQAQVANTSHMIKYLEDTVLRLQVNFAQLEKAALDEKTSHQLENRIAELEGKLHEVLVNHGHFLNNTVQRSSMVNDADNALKNVEEEVSTSATDYGP